MFTIRIIGPGKAGRSLAAALKAVGCRIEGVLGRGDDLRDAASGVDVVLITTPDGVIAEVAAAIAPSPGTAILHCSGSLGLDVLVGHPRRGSLHPLVTLPDPVIGGARLRAGAFFAVAGDTAATDLALALRGHPIVVPEESRAAYHAAACIAANHLVALLGQVERVAASAGLPLAAFLPLARGALDDVDLLGPAAALTGPAAREDLATIERHRAALPEAEVALYDAGVAGAQRLKGVRPPAVPVAAGPWS
ncbi:MAG TPA: Rossmann-like and DUF2520 domain-containing protein [Acidimicrobiales bacterium]|nr:Rossmann-like and DUF2520 domain-containing protein [Acidimicrobiales bacterium]